MRLRIFVPVLLLATAGLLVAAAASARTVLHTAYHDFAVEPVVTGLVRPWSMAFLPGGDLLVTEKGGALRIVRDGVLLEQPVDGVPEVHTKGQAGLLDVAAHPGFAGNRLLYLSYSKPLGDGESTTAVIRGRFEDDRLTGVEEIFEANTRGRGHYGSRLAFDGDGHLFVTVGDRQARPTGDLSAHPAQDLSNHHGVVLRINEDGGIPPDNPFLDQEGAEPATWSYGHRNPQGMVHDPSTGRLWITEHGPQGGDELNLVRAGINYGWPVIGYGVNYGSGKAIHESTKQDGMEQPAKVWVPSIATSGLAIYTGDAFPNWRGHLLAGGLAGQRLELLELDGDKVVREETVLRGMGRVRDVRIGPDGLIYLAMDVQDDVPAILRLRPVPRAEVVR
jgi:glucose/arabinose dehydrogenase